MTLEGAGRKIGSPPARLALPCRSSAPPSIARHSRSLTSGQAVGDPPERLEEIRNWMADTLPKFREILNPQIKEIVGELEGGAASA